MSTSRRDFITKGTLLALAAGVPSALTKTASAAENAGGGPAPTLTKAAFVSQLNTDFFIKHGGGSVRTRLVDVSDLSRPSARPSTKEGFSLLFRGDRSRPLKQETYVIEHAKLGKFSFLIVPAHSSDKSALFYEAVINRLYP